jgi:hypothetical protein
MYRSTLFAACSSIDCRPQAEGEPVYQWPLYTDQKNYLRPEVVESLFYLWRATHHQVKRRRGGSRVMVRSMQFIFALL